MAKSDSVPAASDLAPSELEVLKALWEGSPATCREIHSRLAERGRQLAYTTVLTFLTRLEQKRFVVSDKSGPAYAYRPRITRERVMRSRLQTLLQDLYDGAAAPLVMQLMREESFTPDEIRELQSLIEDLDGQTGRPRSSRKA